MIRLVSNLGFSSYLHKSNSSHTDLATLLHSCCLERRISFFTPTGTGQVLVMEAHFFPPLENINVKLKQLIQCLTFYSEVK